MGDSTTQRTVKGAKEKDESATHTHIHYDCGATVCLRLCHLSVYFIEPGEFQDDTVSKLLLFVQSAGLLKG
jgi:hypothetical protein